MAKGSGGSFRLNLASVLMTFVACVAGPVQVAAEVIWPSYETPARPDLDEMLPAGLEPVDARLPVQVRVSPQPGNYDPTLYYGGVTAHAGVGPLRGTRVYIRSARWELEVFRDSQVRAQIIPVHLNSVLGEALENFFGQLFPAGHTAGKKRRKQDKALPRISPVVWNATYRFVLDVLWGQGRGLDSIRLQLNLQLTDQERASVVAVECSGTSRVGSDFWSPVSLVDTLAEESVVAALEQCSSLLRKSTDLRNRLDRLELETTAAASPTFQAEFDDASALFPNGRLDAGESAQLRVKVRNGGPGKAFALELRIASEESAAILRPLLLLGDLAVGAELTREVEIRGPPSLPSGSMRLRAEVLESRGYAARPIDLEIATAALTPPGLEIFDFALNDATAPAIGDGDGRPGAGETVEAVVRLRNNGPGEARLVQVSLVNPPPSVTSFRAPDPIPGLSPGAAAEVRFVLTLARTGLEPSLDLAFEAVDGRGREAAAVTASKHWNTVARRPKLRLGLQVADGNTQGSVGNGDGIASNGETLELGLTLTNEGTLDAREVRIMVSANVPGLAPHPNEAAIGALPAGARSRDQWLALGLPRTFVLPAGATPLLPLSIRITQGGFAEEQLEIGVPFRSTQPRLQLAVPEGLSLEQGKTLELGFEITNQGELMAEQVQVLLESPAPEVEILDERSLPRRELEVVVGGLAPGASRRLKARLSARTGAPTGAVALLFATQQKDFAGPKATAQVMVGAQEPLVVRSTIELEAPPAPAARDRATPSPTISFLSFQSGARVSQEAIVFRFEVQHGAELADVRLELNGRPLPLSAVVGETDRSGHWSATTYRLPVELAPGENSFEVTAITVDGQRGMRALTLVREEKAGRFFVVAVGVSTYQDPAVAPLRFAHSDAEAVAAYFRTTLALPPDQVLVRTNEQASLRELRSLLGTVLPRLATEAEDTVILYLAGHGVPEPVVGGLDPDGVAKYFLPTDASLSDLYSTALPMDELEMILRRYRAERVVVFLDSCFSGASVTGGRTLFDRSHARRNNLTDEFLSRLASAGKGRAILAASEPNEVAIENSALRHGVFTYYLLEGLRGAADASADGVIDLDELYRYVTNRVIEATDGRQRPMRRYPALLGQILIGRTSSPEETKD